ncbi:MAG: BTAD domain-containing putative transcriptional regulator [Gemmatimonadota bacterium]|jgi:DNA-binding SARP family transcriptional activator/tetratricopeptide (TPR) repeat protein
MIRFHALGTLDLVDSTDGHQILSVLAQPKRLGVLAYLALASPRGNQQRDTLLGVFWPDSTEKRARNALNQTVFVLRRALGQELFSTNGDNGIQINRDHLWCDVWAFEEALGKGEQEEALELYRGDFLNGFFLPGCLEFERWAESERSRLRDQGTGAVLALSQEMALSGNPVGALGWVRRAREWAPYDEKVLCRQIELQLSLGDRSGATREFEAFCSCLSTDLGLEPSDRIREVLNRQPPAADWWPGRVGVHDPAGDSAERALLSGQLPGRARRRFSLSQVILIAFITCLAGMGAALSIPRMWSGTMAAVFPDDPPEGVPRTVLVLPLENATGDPTLDPVGPSAAEEIMLELASSGLVSVRPSHAYPDQLDTTGFQPASPGELASLAPSLPEPDFLVTGSYTIRGGLLVVQARIVDSGSVSITLAVDTVLGSPADPGEALQRIKGAVAGGMAMILDPYLVDLVGVATPPPNLQAYQLVADGLRYLDRTRTTAGDQQEQRELLEAAEGAFLRAAEFSHRFTLPLIFALWSSPFPSDSVLQVLRSQRDDLPQWERAMLDYHMAYQAMDYGGQYEAMKLVVGFTPTRQWRSRLAEAAVRFNRPGEARDLLLELEKDRDWTAERPQFSLWLIEAELLLGNQEGALEHLEFALAQEPDNPRLLAHQVWILAGLGREEEAVQRATELLESTGQKGTRYLRYHLPNLLILSGLEEEGRRLAELGVESFSGIEDARIEYVAATLVAAGRFDEARQVLSNIEDLMPGRRLQAYTLLSYMAAREGLGEGAMRFGEMAATVLKDQGVDRDPYGVMAQAQAAAHLGDNAAAVRFIREAFRLGLPHGLYLFLRWDLRPLEGYKPFEDMMKPKG